MRVESPAEAAMLQQALRQGKIRPENVKRAEMALQAFEGEQSFAKAQREKAQRLGPGLSKAVRGPIEGVAGNITGPVDLAAGIGRELGVTSANPRLGQRFQKLLDRYTTKPRGGWKVAEEAEAIGTGALTGPKLPRFAKMKPGTQQFLRENREVTATPGMRRGGVANWLEQQAAKVHPLIKGARTRAVQQWNTADINNTLRSIGAPELPPGLGPRESLRYMHAQISAGYRRLLNNMKLDPDTGTVPLRARLQQIKQAYAGMDPAQQKNLDDVINDVMRPTSPAVQAHVAAASGRSPAPAGPATGAATPQPGMRSIKEIDRLLRTEVARATRRNTYQDDQLVKALTEIRSSVEQVGQDQNGAAWKEYREHDRAWADWANDVRATKGAKSGWAFTPASKRAAIEKADTSRDKRFTKMGVSSAMPKIDRAESVLSNTEPDSGTPAALGLLEIGRDLFTNPKKAAAMIAGGGVYNEPTLRMLQERALAGKPKLLSTPGALMGGAQGAQQGEPDPEMTEALQRFGVAQP